MARVKAGAASSIPRPPEHGESHARGGEADLRIKDPDLRSAFARAHFAWAKAKAPWLLEDWLA